MKNPKAALAVLNAPEAVKIGDYNVRDITFAMAGILEEINSPIYSGKPARNMLDWIPTIYALTREPEKSTAVLAAGVPAYTQVALAWADTITVRDAKAMIDAANAAVLRLNAIDAEDDDPEGGAEKNPSAAGPTAG